MERATCLYYPWTSLEGRPALQSMLLVWNQVRTIVPFGLPIAPPEQHKPLYDAGVINPLSVDEGNPAVQVASERVLAMLQDQRVLEKLSSMGPNDMGRMTMWDRKMTFALREYLAEKQLRVPGDLPHRADVEGHIAGAYMSVLADEIALQQAYVPVTDQLLEHDLLTLELSVPVDQEGDLGPSESMQPAVQAGAKLIELSLMGLELGQSTDLRQVVAFREKHSDEIGRFRHEVFSLAKALVTDDAGNLEERCRAAYINQIQPAIEELSKSLKGARLDWISGVVSLGIFGAGTLAIPVAGPAGPIVALAGAIGVSATRAHAKRQDLLSGSPYSFLVAAKKSLG
jgi:hypothetical protein